jgi:glutathione synthase/RimK-type ligase-like ATP-grasp enzyme
LGTVAFLTLQHRRDYVIDDELAVEPLGELGWHVDAIPWQQRGVAWRDYDAVVIRSTWDYTEAPEAFLRVLRDIEGAGVPLFNPLRLVEWNLRKTYLGDLAKRGVAIVPTLSRTRLHPGELDDLFDELGASEIVLKPVIGLNADGAFRVEAPARHEQSAAVERYYAGRELLAQPFVPAIVAEGEFSLFYFNGEHSHTVLKTPTAGDFRVQEEHGGLIRDVQADAALLAAADAALAALGEVPLYARADFVRAPAGAGYWLMELELIEPSMYLRMDDRAPARFARALHERITPSRDRSGSPTRRPNAR